MRPESPAHFHPTLMEKLGLQVFLSSVGRAYNTELYRLPLIITKTSYAFAFIVIAIAALISGLLVRRQCDRLDLIAVLKTRE